jgi:hypothetical protein
MTQKTSYKTNPDRIGDTVPLLTESSYDLSEIPTSELAREMGRRAAPSQAARRILSHCQFCTLPFGVKEMRRHIPVCVKNPRRRKVEANNAE